MLMATETIRSVHKHSNMATLHVGRWGGGGGGYFVLNFGNGPDLLCQDCRLSFGSVGHLGLNCDFSKWASLS